MKRLRETGTDAERKLWFHLQGRRLCGYKFRRQHPLTPYVVDFYCDELKLVVELDGSQHTTKNDCNRTAALEKRGATILRFRDNEVLKETESVLHAILGATHSRTLTPALRARRYAPPLPKGEGL